jgi:CHAD domain-containing protein
VSSTVAAATEREVKLGAWPGFRLPDLDGVAPWVRAEPASERLLEAVYFDAPDLRLTRSGITVRHRTGEGADVGMWTAKLPGGVTNGALERTEVTVEGPGGDPPEALVRVLRGTLRGACLVPVARLATRRTLVELRDGGGRRLAEVCDDEVSVLEDERVAARFREVEVEASRAAPSTLLPLVVSTLRSAGAGEPDPTSKLVRALGPRALAPADPPIPPLGASPSAGLVVRVAFAASVQRLLDYEPFLRLDGPVTAIHQARVATRRLRSDLKTFGPLVEEAWATALRADLKVLADRLGEVRDTDVLALRLERAGRELDRVDGVHVVRLVRRLRWTRHRRWEDVIALLDGEEHLALLERLVEAARAPRLLEAADAPARPTIRRLVKAPWQRLVRTARDLGPEASDRQLHEFRIRVKRARYAVEAATRVIPEAAGHAAALADLQGVLGDQHDAVVAQAWLRAIVGEGTSRRQAFAAGLLVAAQEKEAEMLRAAWPDAWSAAHRKKMATWLAR